MAEEPAPLRVHGWTPSIGLAGLVAALVVAHGVLYYAVSHLAAVSAAAASGVAIVVALKHLGFLGPLYGLCRRRRRRR